MKGDKLPNWKICTDRWDKARGREEKRTILRRLESYFFRLARRDRKVELESDKIEPERTVENYTYQATWSDQAQAFIAACKELPGITADHSDSPEKAIMECKGAAVLMVESMKEDGELIPTPGDF